MRLRRPLYAQILFWFFLNLLVLLAALLVLVRAEVHSGYDWLLAAGAGQRIQAVGDVLLADLREHERTEWTSILKRFDEAYQLQFLLFDNSDGAQIAGDPIPLPPAVRARLPDQNHPPGRRGPPWVNPERLPERARPPGPPLAGPPPQGENAKWVVRTSEPTRYWVLVRVGARDSVMPRPMPATLVIVSPTMTGGGLFFDFKPWAAGGIGVLALSALLWFPFVRSLTRSIGQMTHATRRIAEGHFDGRVAEQRQDELGSLGQSINRMAERLDGFVTGQKRFLGDIAHELCAPIARIQMALGILEQRADEKNRLYVEDLREEIQHMSNLVNELLSFSKLGLGVSTVQLKPVPLREVVEAAARREDGPEGAIRLEVPGELSVMAEPELLLRAVANLLRNALRYAGSAGPISVTARREAEAVLLVIADHGPGVPESELARIFDPFYRLDPAREAATGGVGLGLAIVKTCVESCGGSVRCGNREPSGLEVVLQLVAASGVANPR